jgi:hypothetical protein
VRDYHAHWVKQASPPTGAGINTFLRNKLVAIFLSDKLVAIDREKAEFRYQLCRANGARRIVEAGTSFGVSTLYLAAAVRDNTRAAGGATNGVVIATEHEPSKVLAAKAYFQEVLSICAKGICAKRSSWLMGQSTLCWWTSGCLWRDLRWNWSPPI